MKLLMIGGNGNISWYCVEEALKRGHEVWEINRSQTLLTRRDIQPEVHKLTADIHDTEKIKALLDGCEFDVVIDFICFQGSDAEEATDLFSGSTKHFIFISSTAIYRRAGRNFPFQENCELTDFDRADAYVRGKIEAEEVFRKAYVEQGFPVTIVRPAYTYDVIVPVSIGHNCFTAPQKYLEGRPALIAGNGTNIWAFTHAHDFAGALLPLAENIDTVGETFHIATDEWLSWNEEMEILFRALGIASYRSIHIPYDEALALSFFPPRDLMEKMCDNICDTAKLKAYVPGWKTQISFEEGIRQTMDWLKEKAVRRRYNAKYGAALDELYKKYER